MPTRSAARIFRSISAPRNLRGVYETHVRSGTARGRDGIDPEALARDIAVTCDRVSRNMRAGSHHFTQYRQLLMSKGAGKAPRVISIPSARDRIVLRSLANLLVELFPASKGTIPQQRIEEVRSTLNTGSRAAYVRIDVREFYPSVPHLAIRSRLSTKIHKPEILSIIMSAITTPTVPDGMPKRNGTDCRGVPQGLAISNLLAEILATEVDSQFVNYSRVDYFRFVDDVLLLCDATDSVQLYDEAAAAFGRIGLDVHPKEAPGSKSSIGLVVDGFDYLGYVFMGSRVTVRATSVRRLESALARAFTRYAKTVRAATDTEVTSRAFAKCAWDVNLIVSGCIYRGIGRGWLQYFRQMDDLTLLKRMDATVDSFARRFALPPAFNSKSFMRTYWILRHPKSRSGNYIPDFDRFSVEQMRDYLRNVAGVPNADRMMDSTARTEFFRLISREVSDLEMDIGLVS